MNKYIENFFYITGISFITVIYKNLIRFRINYFKYNCSIKWFYFSINKSIANEYFQFLFRENNLKSLILE